MSVQLRRTFWIFLIAIVARFSVMSPGKVEAGIAFACFSISLFFSGSWEVQMSQSVRRLMLRRKRWYPLRFVIALFIALFVSALVGTMPAQGQMLAKSGTYTGNGTSQTITVGFQPDLVVVDGINGGTEAVIRTSTMPATYSKDIDQANALATNKISSFTATGFTIGGDADVNQSSIVYHWVAMKAEAGILKLGSYPGTGSNQTITGVGFRPDYVVVMSAGAHDAIQRSSTMLPNFSMNYQAEAYDNAITGFHADGFYVGTNTYVNYSGTTYYYAAWAVAPGSVAVGSYIGSGSDSRNITGTDFLPEWVIVNRAYADGTTGSQGNAPAHKPASTGLTTDSSLLFDGNVAEADNIQRLQANGFQVGTHNRVNGTTAPNAYHWVAFGPSRLYRSVGPTVTPLASGTSNGLTISGSTATFDSSLPDKIGVGDAIQYDSDNNGSIDAIAFIHGRTSSRVYTVKNNDGGTPTQTAAKDNDWAIYRAYTVLDNWENQFANNSIDGTVRSQVNPPTNLTTTGIQLNVACYGDGQDSTAVTIDGWTTGPTNYIKIFTPVSSSEVGTSQRHRGTWSTSAYRLVVSYACAIRVSNNYVNIDGLQVYVSDVDNYDQGGIYYNNMTGAAVGTVSNCIVRGTNAGAYDSHFGIGFYNVGTLTLYVYNNIVYDFQGNNMNCGLVADDASSTMYAYNNTIHNCYGGIYRWNGSTLVAKNNLIKGSGNTYTYDVTPFSTGTDYNATDSTDTPGVGSNNRTSQTFSFVNESGDDFHLTSSDAGARNWGTDLSSDSYLPFSTDIDGQSRPSGSQWDIGADEAIRQVYYSVGQNTYDHKTGGIAYIGAGTPGEGTGDVTPGLPSGWQANDIFLLFVESANQPGSAPSGWTVVTGSPQGTGTAGGTGATALEVYWRRATSSESAPTVTDRGDHTYAVILAFRGVVTSGNPWDTTSSGVESTVDTSLSATGATTSIANDLVVIACARADASLGPSFSTWANADLSNLAEIFDTGTTQGNGGGLGIATGTKASAGIYVATTATLAVASRKGFMTIALKPNAQPPTLTMSGGIATFSLGQTATNMGVGDKVTYGGSTIAYISGKISSTQWTLVTATGGTPPDVGTATVVNSIAHVFASLNGAVGGASPGAAGASYLNTANLVTGDYVLNIPCYYDTGADGTAVTISAWTTGANNYIKIYTPQNTSTECNQSQRHNGKWDDSKYRLETAGTGSTCPINITGAGDVWIDGLQIYLNPPGGNGNAGILVNQTATVTNHKISNNIIRSVTNPTYNYMGIYMYAAAAASNARIWNNIIYDFNGASGWGIAFSSSNFTGYVYNNTVYNCAQGYHQDAGTVIAKNNISYSNTDNYSGTFDATSTNNLSGPSQSDAPGSNPRNAVTVAFVDPTGTPRDLHLASSDASAMESGADLSSDGYIALSNDIDGQGRPFGLYWDIGADEYISPTAVKLISFTATQYPDAVLLRWKTGYEVNNLGFHVYREENGQLIRLTPEPVAGSALMAGSRTALTAGHRYHWWDASLSPHSSSLKYWLKDIDLNGTETMHGPVTPVISREPIPEKFRPELLSEIGWRLQDRYDQYWKVRDLKERFRQKSSVIGHRSSALKSQSSVLSPRHLRPRVQTSSFDTSMQQFLASRPAIKLLVKEEGWYRASQPELLAVGLSSKVNPKYLQLFVEGQEQPIRVIGDKDGRFDPGDAIEFYGDGLDTPSTDTRVYWLIEGTKPGKRIHEFKGYSGSLGSLSSSSYPYMIEKKERRIYFAALRNGDEGNFFGPLVYPAAQVDQLLDIRHLDPGASGDALLEVSLQGVTTVAHRVKVLINEVEVGEVVFEGQSRGTVNLPVSQSLLEEGDNVVTLEARGGEMDASVIESIRLTYWHTYMADDNALKFTAPGGGQVSIGGFGNLGIRVFDITDSNELIEVIGKVELQKGGYAVSFRVPGTGQRTLLALTEEKVKGLEGITSNQPSSWCQTRDGYDLVIVSHRDFLGSVDPLRKLRESQGLRVALIDIEDLYDEFGFGIKSPEAIKDFLTYAKTKWQKPPRFVLLVGDASYDPRNYLGQGNFDLMPTKLVDTAYFETASDDWFVDFNNDGLPEMAIGRLPVQTAEEAGIIVSKIVGYERSGAKREALLVSDKVERSDDFDFERASEEVRALLPSSLLVRKIYRGQFSSDAQARQELINDINQGPLLVNFIGHGSIGIWNGVLSSEDVEYFTNTGLPFIVGMSCLNGHFQDIYMDSLSEALMKAPGGGAVAVWMSSGLTEPDKQAVMNKELMKLLFSGQSLTLGEATARAKASVSDQDIRKTWILFGDPTTRLK